MKEIPEVYVVRQDLYGDGFDSLFGCYYEEAEAEDDIAKYLDDHGPRYDRGDFRIDGMKVIR